VKIQDSIFNGTFIPKITKGTIKWLGLFLLTFGAVQSLDGGPFGANHLFQMADKSEGERKHNSGSLRWAIAGQSSP
jgi:hypothetical protein